VIADLKPYKDYRESGSEWIGRIPSHWETRQVRHVGRLLKGIGGTKEDITSAGVPCVRYGELYTTFSYFIRAPRAFVLESRAGAYTPIHKGDVLFAASGETLDEIGKSAVNLLMSKAVCGGDVIVLRSSEVNDPEFLGYALDCYPSAAQKATMGRGTTVKHIYPDELRGLLFARPPLAEQPAIVRFLNWANDRLGWTILAKRKVIALLNEQKQAIIHRAVTRGLDPAVHLKPSGVPWLGDIPYHWDLMRTKLLAHIKTGGRDTADRIDGAAYPFFVRSQTVERIDTFSFDGEAVLTAGDGAGVAKVFHYIDGKFDYHQRVYKFSDFSGVSGRFFFLYLKSTLRFEALDASAKSTVDSLRLPLLQNFPTLVPPDEEQLAIVRAVGLKTAELDKVISRVTREIELLAEYRTRLVADVVTGKLDVREAASRLPDEPSGPQLDDETEGNLDADEEDGE
jgi:type I restriction enzyme S subunit